MENKKNINVDALFLGPKAENEEFFLKNLTKMFNEHSQWRKNFHPEDGDIITSTRARKESFIDTQCKTEEMLEELSCKLRSNMMPWHSMRYIGHMNTDTLMASLLGYFAAMLYNGNNCAYEGAPATTILEGEVGEDFCRLCGIDSDTGWGHISLDGTTANLESLWYMRNIKSIPFAIKKVAPEIVEGMTEWQLLNLSVKDTLDLLDKVPDKFDKIKNNSARCDANLITKLGKLLVPKTKHYSWLKAADILGIGGDSLVEVPVDEHFRMDIAALKSIIEETTSKNIPILGIVAVVGSTEEGAVDHVDKIVELKEEFRKKGINFYFHIDAAFGSYCRSMFLDEDYNFIPENQLKSKYKEYGVFQNCEAINWPSHDVYKAFEAIKEADSITIDPHKMGYVPYAAGGICIQDKRIKDCISYFANYTFEKGMDIPVLLGAFTLEGSKPGASAASVWAAHKVLPLNISGYGKLIGASIEGANMIYDRINSQKTFKVLDKNITVKTLVDPDFNMINFAFNIEGNTDLSLMNELTHGFYEEASFCTKLFTNEFITSHTILSRDEYGDSPLKFVKTCGISEEEWKRIGSVSILRATCINPFFSDEKTFNEYNEKISKAIVNDLEIVLKRIESK